jgi:3,4-dihydroxy 2-butanone 4-phosphate synthase/GTP cyclohydrolase II
MLSVVPAPASGAGRSSPIASTAEIIEEIRNGRIVVLVDDEDRENEGDLIFAADFVTPEKINFLSKFGRGLVCMPITPEHAQRLQLAPMAVHNRTVHGTNFTVAIEAATGVTTGISAADRAHTIRVATRPDAKPADIVHPGHVFPLVAQAGGVLVRAGHTEACCDLARLAGLNPAAVLCEVMNDDGTMARLPDLVPFAQTHGLKIGTIADLIHYRAANESLVQRIGSRRVQTVAGEFELVAYRDVLGDVPGDTAGDATRAGASARTAGTPHLALVRGDIAPEHEVLVRVHEPLSVLDLIDTDVSTHSWPFAKALAAIAQAGSGVLLLMNCGESAERLLGQFNALADLQTAPEAGAAGSNARRLDLRTYGIGAQILRDLGVGRMKLLARPRKMPSMAGFGLVTTGYLEG